MSGQDPSGPQQPKPDAGGQQPEGDTLAGAAPARRRRAAWAIPVVVAVVAVALVGSGLALASVLRGGGTQPEQVLPANAVAFAEVDLDPAAGQKVSAMRFARQFPQLADHVRGNDLRRTVFEALAEHDNDLRSVSYKRDVQPWLGDRMAVAAVPPAAGDEGVRTVAALQVKDEDAARAGIRKLSRAGADPAGRDHGLAGLVLSDGYALLAENQSSADRLAAEAENSSLADSQPFARDMDKLGENGISSGWVDAKAMSRLAGKADPRAAQLLGAQPLSGTFTYALRFDADDLELVAHSQRMKTVKPVTGSSSTGLERLPSSTLAGFGVANGDGMVRRGWAEAVEQGGPTGQQLDMLEQQAQAYGFTLPDDLGTLFGSSFAFALDGKRVAGPQVGARSTTDTAEAGAVLDAIERLAGQAAGQRLPLARKPTADGLVVANDPAYADKLSRDGSLGDTDGFTSALPEADDADVAVWLDPDRLADLPAAGIEPEKAETLRAVDGVGLTGTIEGAGELTYRVRVVTR